MEQWKRDVQADEILTGRWLKNVAVLAVLQCTVVHGDKDLILLRQAKFPKLETWWYSVFGEAVGGSGHGGSGGDAPPHRLRVSG
jgi:hypothetical protein